MISIEELKDYSKKLEFYMKEEEYKTLQSEFDILLKQVEFIDNIDGIKDYDPLSFPFPLDDAFLREDRITMSLDKSEALSNCKDVKDECVKLPKVVG